VLLLQTPNPIFELAVFALRKQVGYRVSTAQGILTGISGPIVHDLADLELWNAIRFHPWLGDQSRRSVISRGLTFPFHLE
jgi:hypothetical protein